MAKTTAKAKRAAGAFQSRAARGGQGAGTSGGWTFLTNHAHVLLCVAADPGVRLRDVAGRVGITERAVQKIVRELEETGALSRSREGRRNRYRVRPGHHLHHPIEAHCTIGDLLRLVLGDRQAAAKG